ncbi:MAG: hypothetical protein AAGI52_17110 [Bacteroidota bacterium]
MRLAALTAVLGFALLLADASAAQIASDLPGPTAPVEVVSSPQAPTLSLAGLFNAETINLSHSYQFGYQSGFGGDLGMGVYTTSLRWQPSARLAGRVDVGFAHGAFGSLADAAGFSPDRPVRPFLQNAEIGWRPTENSLIHLQVSQTPYGAACTHSYQAGCANDRYRGGYGSALGVNTGGDLFWRGDLNGDGDQ